MRSQHTENVMRSGGPPRPAPKGFPYRNHRTLQQVDLENARQRRKLAELPTW